MNGAIRMIVCGGGAAIFSACIYGLTIKNVWEKFCYTMMMVGCGVMYAGLLYLALVCEGVL